MEFRRVQPKRVRFDALDSQDFVPNNVQFASKKGYAKREVEEDPEQAEYEAFVREQEEEAKREKKKEKAKDALDSGDLDLKAVIAKAKGDRQRWLTRILKLANEGKIKNKLSSLYDIISHRKFAAGLDDHQGRRMRYEILKKSQLFSAKQQQFLKSTNWPMEKEFGGEGNGPQKPTDEGAGEEGEETSRPASSVGFNFGAGSSKDSQSPAATSASAAAAPAVSSGVDTSAVLSMLSKTAAFATSASTAAAPAVSSGVDTSAVLSMLQKTALFAPSFLSQGEGDGALKPRTAPVKSSQQVKADEQPTPSVAPKETPKEAPKETPKETPKDKGIYLPDRMATKMSQSEFDSKFAEKARSVCKKNPDHEGLSQIKREVLAERGLARSRSRSRSPDSRSRSPVSRSPVKREPVKVAERGRSPRGRSHVDERELARPRSKSKLREIARPRSRSRRREDNRGANEADDNGRDRRDDNGRDRRDDNGRDRRQEARGVNEVEDRGRDRRREETRGGTAADDRGREQRREQTSVRRREQPRSVAWNGPRK